MVLHPKKKERLSEKEKKLEEVGDRWTYVNILPRSGFIHTIHHGKRNKKEAKRFISKIKTNSNGESPLFLSDGWAEYEEALRESYSYRDKKTGELKIDPKLKYAQIVKVKEAGRLKEIEQRVVFGREQEILKVIKQEGRGKQFNTSYVESRNGKYRKDNKRLTRRTMCHSKKVKVHDAQIDWITGVYNFCKDIEAFRVCCNKKAKRFETKYRKRSPAMVEGMLSKILTLEELLIIRVY